MMCLLGEGGLVGKQGIYHIGINYVGIIFPYSPLSTSKFEVYCAS